MFGRELSSPMGPVGALQHSNKMGKSVFCAASWALFWFALYFCFVSPAVIVLDGIQGLDRQRESVSQVDSVLLSACKPLGL